MPPIDLAATATPTNQDDEPVFAEPWEAQAFALVIGLYEKGLFTWTEWAEVLSREIAADGGDTPYYNLWLQALEAIVLEKAATNADEIEARGAAWQAALKATPHGKPILLENGQ